MRGRTISLVGLAAWGLLLAGGWARVEGVNTAIAPVRLVVQTPSPMLLEPRLLMVEWPATVKQNVSSEIVLSIQAGEQGQVAPSAAGSTTDLFKTHNVVAAARLELPGVETGLGDLLEAPGTLRQALQPGRSITFRWNIRANRPGVYPGTVWLHLDLVPRDGGEVEEILLLARQIEVRAVTVFGMPANVARWVSLAGIATGFLLGYPYLFDWLESAHQKVSRSRGRGDRHKE